MSDDQRVEAKRKRDNLAEEASAREYLRRRHNFQVKLNSGRRAAAAPPPDSGAPTSGVAAGATDLQQASSDMLAVLTPARVSELQSEINAGASVLTEADEADFLNALVPPLNTDTTRQSP